jgi:ABC-type lipoprotein release transport system permease subunit
VTPRDPIALLSGPLALALVAALAIWLPARRAMRLNPVAALRVE